MSSIDELRSEITAARATLGKRQSTTTDERERKALTAVSKALAAQLAALQQADVVTAARALTKVSDLLEKAVAATRTGPFDNYLGALQSHFDRLGSIAQSLHTSEAAQLESAPEVAAGSRPAAPIRTASVQSLRSRATAGGAASLGAPSAPSAAFVPAVSTKFADLQSEYEHLWQRCTVRPEFQSNVKYYLERLNKGRAAYDAVGQELKIPWAFIGVIHGMECSFNFYGHLHNGDPLTARTVQVPNGRPLDGAPPYTWRDSALDALTLKKLHLVQDWSVPNMLWLLESYNGFGYRKRQVPSPYLWSFSSVYEKGKFVQDGAFDPNAVSKQCGAALMLKHVLNA